MYNYDNIYNIVVVDLVQRRGFDTKCTKKNHLNTFYDREKANQ